MIAALTIVSTDDVVEFAPGLGITAQLALKRRPASYMAVERDSAGGGDSEQLPERVNTKVCDGKCRSDWPAWRDCDCRLRGGDAHNANIGDEAPHSP